MDVETPRLSLCSTIRENRRAERAKRQHDGFFIDIRGAVG